MLAIERKNEILSILQKEQRVLVSELSQRYNVTEETIRRDLEKLERGDIIVFTAETPELAGTTLIKRLIGLPGDHVEIDENGTVTINGEVQQESYVVYQYAIPSEFDVPEGYYLFMGDNRANSMDSRYWQNPYVSGESIQGRAIFTLFPFSNFGKLQ